MYEWTWLLSEMSAVFLLHSQADTVAGLSYLEAKEEQLSSRIKVLKQEVLAAGKRVGLDPAELQNLVEVCVPNCVY